MTALFRIGARGSPLSMTQARWVQGRLAAALGVSEDERDARVPLIFFTTTGDKITDRPLLEAGGKGLFTKELDEALIDRRIDLAVHSAKDLPTTLPAPIAFVCTPGREDPRDAFIARNARTLADLPAGAVVGSASLRRQAQVLFHRPDLKVALLRGNVETRLRKIEEGAFDATFLALAGLKRLGLAAHVSSVVALEDMPPAPGQGALAITARTDDVATREALAKLNDHAVELALAAERGFLAELDGSCRSAIGAYAQIVGAEMRLVGEVLSPDGAVRIRREEAGAAKDAVAAATFGREIARALREAAGDHMPAFS
jgi:hydroxymethylbilane synthase